MAGLLPRSASLAPTHPAPRGQSQLHPQWQASFLGQHPLPPAPPQPCPEANHSHTPLSRFCPQTHWKNPDAGKD